MTMSDPTTWEELAQKTESLRPFITPTDVSVYDTIYPSKAHPKIAIIASLMNELYTIFIKMHYLPPSSVSFAPHTSTPISLRHAALFGLEKQVVDLLQLLPNHDKTRPTWNFGSDAGEFVHGGEFDEDIRGEGKEEAWWRKCVDPLYHLDVGREGQSAVGWSLVCEDLDEESGEMEEEEEKEKGWLMIDEPEEDDLEDQDWQVDEEETSDTSSLDSEDDTNEEQAFEDEIIQEEELVLLQQDTFLAEAALEEQKVADARAEEESQARRRVYREDLRNERLLLYIRPWHVTLNSIGNHGTVLFLNTHNFTISETGFGNICDFRHNAIPYLRNIVTNFKDLTWMPGGLCSPVDGERYAAYKQLYLDTGWPETFDGDKFDKLREKYENKIHQRYRDQAPLRELCGHIAEMQSRELSKLHYHHAIQKLSLLPSTAETSERKHLEQTIDRCGREFLPSYFEPVGEDVLKGLTTKLDDMLNKGCTEQQVKYMRTAIAETKLEMQATSFEERDWSFYELRRKEALAVDVETRVMFDWHGAWRGSKIDPDVVLTPEMIQEMARERFERYKK
ncbi:unnamed protein product [Aureobasidium vineae]|uniref:Uncharacterized protein n=1 Tax=Aureobasidium vineae TaxID=2773715 RepID=A0A9N8JBW0_9PEZI|nr:unnamed protein product [Aureobasidium vineae]